MERERVIIETDLQNFAQMLVERIILVEDRLTLLELELREGLPIGSIAKARERVEEES